MKRRKITQQEDMLNRIRALEGDQDDFSVALCAVDRRNGVVSERVKAVEADVGAIHKQVDGWSQPHVFLQEYASIGAVQPVPVTRKWWQFWKRG